MVWLEDGDGPDEQQKLTEGMISFAVGVPEGSNTRIDPLAAATVYSVVLGLATVNFWLVGILQDDEALQGWLASNEFACLTRLPDSGSSLKGMKMVLRVRDLEAGQLYLPVPSRGGIKRILESVSKVEGFTKNQVRKSERELEAAVVKYAPELLGWPFGVAEPTSS